MYSIIGYIPYFVQHICVAYLTPNSLYLLLSHSYVTPPASLLCSLYLWVCWRNSFLIASCQTGESRDFGIRQLWLQISFMAHPHWMFGKTWMSLNSFFACDVGILNCKQSGLERKMNNMQEVLGVDNSNYHSPFTNSCWFHQRWTWKREAVERWDEAADEIQGIPGVHRKLLKTTHFLLKPGPYKASPRVPSGWRQTKNAQPFQMTATASTVPETMC